MTRTEVVAKLREIASACLDGPPEKECLAIADALEQETLELERVRDEILQSAKAVWVKSDQTVASLGDEHVAARSLEFAAASLDTWADALTKLIGDRK